jgi:iron uptake system EfeUOB component EfeO/EfeM
VRGSRSEPAGRRAPRPPRGYRWAQEVAVTLTDQGCDPTSLTVDAGAVSFVITNSSSSRSEFEVRTSKPSIVGETEGIPAGGSGTLDLDLKDGTYNLSCGTGDVFEDALVVGSGRRAGHGHDVGRCRSAGAVAATRPT